MLAALGHAGGQGSSAYSQAPLWAPSRVPEVNTREVPKWMEACDIEAVVAGFASASAAAVAAGLDGVEVNAGQHSLVRQFLSGLTNQRSDEWGTDRLLFARQVLGAVRSAIGDAVLGLRLSLRRARPLGRHRPRGGRGHRGRARRPRRLRDGRAGLDLHRRRRRARTRTSRPGSTSSSPDSSAPRFRRTWPSSPRAPSSTLTTWSRPWPRVCATPSR